jgi:hypothetical protein
LGDSPEASSIPTSLPIPKEMVAAMGSPGPQKRAKKSIEIQ